MKKFLIAAAIISMMAIVTPVFAEANPFMDVPVSHWAYDAVARLAASGVISGYPDGTFKGPQPATRYEIASIIARSLSSVDMEKASKQDVETLRRLIIEFSDELNALGVKAEGLDSRLAVMEKNIGGWKLSGEFDFRAGFGDSKNGYHNIAGKNDFKLDRYRIWMTKRINDTTSFTTRFGTPNDGSRLGAAGPVRWDRYFITTKLGYDITMSAGRNYTNWEDELGFMLDYDVTVGGYALNMFNFKKAWSNAQAEMIIGRADDNMGNRMVASADGAMRGFAGGFKVDPYGPAGNPTNDAKNHYFNNDEYLMLAGKLNFDVSEKFSAGVMGYYWIEDSDRNKSPLSAYGRMRAWSGGNLADTQNFWRDTAAGDYDFWTLGGYTKFNFTPSVTLKGLYYYQNMGDDLAWRMNNFGVITDPSSPNNGDPIYDSSASAWKAVLDVKQDALRFTSLMLEYASLDNNFVYSRTYFAETWPYGDSDGNLLRNQPYNLATTKVYLARANQRWNDKWDTFLRYAHADYGTSYIDDADNWTVGVGYRLNDAVKFTLSYDYLDFGDAVRPGDPANGVKESHNLGNATGDDHVIRFRTQVMF